MPKDRDPSGFGIATATFTLMTMLLAFAALAVAGAALGNSEDAKDQAAAGSAPVVTLSEFSIEPAMVDVAAGGALNVKKQAQSRTISSSRAPTCARPTSTPEEARRSISRA